MPTMPLPHLKTTPDQIAPHILTVGDPRRAAEAAGLLEDAREVGNNREYLTFTGRFQGAPVTVCSHGVGASGASICFQELFQGEVRHIIRAGTCGAMQKEIDDGQLLIATAAVRQDGASPFFVPMEFPAFADRHVVAALEAAVEAEQAKTYPGVVLTQGYFYPELISEPAELWMKAGVIGVEMEMAVLFVLASLHGVRAGGILVSDGNLARELETGALQDPEHYNPHRDVVAEGVQRMLRVGLSALVRLASAG